MKKVLKAIITSMLLLVMMAIVFVIPASGAPVRDDIWVESAQPLHFQDELVLGFTYKVTPAKTQMPGNPGPWLWTSCYKGDVLVYSEFRAGFEGGYKYGVPFQLGPTARWAEGAASCIGELGHVSRTGRIVIDADVKFEVEA